MEYVVLDGHATLAFSRTDLARLLGIDRRTTVRWEDAQTLPTATVFRNMESPLTGRTERVPLYTRPQIEVLLRLMEQHKVCRWSRVPEAFKKQLAAQWPTGASE